MTILDKLADHARERCELYKAEMPLSELRRKAESLPIGDLPFEAALRKPGISFICEVKKASPSKGIIAVDFPYLSIAREYEAAGADCISVLTEPKWFLGSDGYLEEIARSVSIPCLRKDFTVDEYMIYQAKLLGASAVLLICSILDEGRLGEYIMLARSLGLTALVEAHDEKEGGTTTDTATHSPLRQGCQVLHQPTAQLWQTSASVHWCKKIPRLPAGIQYHQAAADFIRFLSCTGQGGKRGCLVQCFGRH